MGDEALELGIKVRTSSFTRHHVNITMTRAKSTVPTSTRCWPCRKPFPAAPTKR